MQQSWGYAPQYVGLWGVGGQYWAEGSGSDGPNSPTLAATDPEGISWGDFPERIIEADGSFASAGTRAEPTDWLVAKDFGFGVPDGATIVGIKAEYLCYATQEQDFPEVVLVIGGEVDVGAVSGDEEVTFPVGEENVAYVQWGDDSDTWAAALTPEIVNSPDFGVAIRFLEIAGFFQTANVDHVRLTVYWA